MKNAWGSARRGARQRIVSTLVQRVLIIWTGFDKFKKGSAQPLSRGLRPPARHAHRERFPASPNKINRLRDTPTSCPCRTATSGMPITTHCASNSN
ncbi:protein of unknown function [Burkholderia multivorans]